MPAKEGLDLTAELDLHELLGPEYHSPKAIRDLD